MNRREFLKGLSRLALTIPIVKEVVGTDSKETDSKVADFVHTSFQFPDPVSSGSYQFHWDDGVPIPRWTVTPVYLPDRIDHYLTDGVVEYVIKGKTMEVIKKEQA